VHAFNEVTHKTVLGVVALVRAFSIQAVDALARLTLVFETGLIVRDLFREFTELLEQVASFVYELRPGRYCAGDEVVRANVQSGFF
jgi:hypothetical protein